MKPETVKLLLFTLLAVAIALKADIGTPPFPDDVRGYLSYAYTGIIAGCTAALGPEAASRLREMFRGA